MPPSGGSAEGEKDEDLFDDQPAKDLVLVLLLDLILGFNDEMEENNFGLTVTSNGAVVSGLAVSRRRWSRELAGLLEDGAPQVSEALAGWLTKAFDRTSELNEKRLQNDVSPVSRTFLHLSKARIYTPNGNLDVPVWRGSLADITSWSLGSHSK